MAWRRLFFGEPRLCVIGVDFAVFGDERALRTLGTDGVAETLTLGFTGAVNSENLGGFTKPASLLIFDFFVGELNADGSTFSESASS